MYYYYYIYIRTYIYTVPTVSFTEDGYTVAEESGEVTVCLVMNITVITRTETTFGVTLSASDGPLATGACKHNM